MDQVLIAVQARIFHPPGPAETAFQTALERRQRQSRTQTLPAPRHDIRYCVREWGKQHHTTQVQRLIAPVQIKNGAVERRQRQSRRGGNHCVTGRFSR